MSDLLSAAELQRILEDLTPGGSEFVGNSRRCAEFVRDRLATAGNLAKERNDLRIQLAEAAKDTDFWTQTAANIAKELVCIHLLLETVTQERDMYRVTHESTAPALRKRAENAEEKAELADKMAIYERAAAWLPAENWRCSNRHCWPITEPITGDVHCPECGRSPVETDSKMNPVKFGFSKKDWLACYDALEKKERELK